MYVNNVPIMVGIVSYSSAQRPPSTVCIEYEGLLLAAGY